MDIVYIETTVVSYLVADPSRDVVTAGLQQATRDWWQQRRGEFHCITSAETLGESGRGDAEQARRRMAVLAGLTLVPAGLDAEKLTERFLASGALPAWARSDAIPLAVAVAVEADFLLTWNCRHLANAQILRRLEEEVLDAGRRMPRVCTHLELMGDSPYET